MLVPRKACGTFWLKSPAAGFRALHIKAKRRNTPAWDMARPLCFTNQMSGERAMSGLQKHRALIAFVILAAAGAATQAQPVSIYSEDFESRTSYPEWSSNMTRNTAARPAFSAFNGLNGRRNITLTLGALPTLPVVPPGAGGLNGGGFNLPTNPGTGGGTGGDTGGDTGGNTGSGALSYRLNLTFDFYAIDSWDGSESTFGVDKFLVRANNTLIFDESFTNQAGNPQSYAGTPQVSGVNLGFNTFNDSIYRNVSLDFTVEQGQPIVLLFTDTLNQITNDEAWGIDNVQVSYTVVPAPGALAMFGGLGAFAARRRR